MARSIRRLAVVSLAAVLLPALNACYEYAPLTTDVPPQNQTVALQITDQGRVGLSDRFGPGLAEVVGKVAAREGDDFLVNIYSVSTISGETTQWAGESARLNRSYIGSIKGRRFSKSRTALVAIAAAAATGYFIYAHGLNGSYSGPTTDPSPGPGPVSQRVPFGRSY